MYWWVVFSENIIFLKLTEGVNDGSLSLRCWEKCWSSVLSGSNLTLSALLQPRTSFRDSCNDSQFALSVSCVAKIAISSAWPNFRVGFPSLISGEMLSIKRIGDIGNQSLGQPTADILRRANVLI